MEINAVKTVKVNAQTLKLHIKVCDRFECDLFDQDGAKIIEYEGYVPGFFPGYHHHDYLILDIDIDTGRITNWTAPTTQELEEFIAKKED